MHNFRRFVNSQLALDACSKWGPSSMLRKISWQLIAWSLSSSDIVASKNLTIHEVEEEKEIIQESLCEVPKQI